MKTSVAAKDVPVCSPILLVAFFVALPGTARSGGNELPELNRDPRPSDFVEKIYSSGERVKRGAVPYLIVLWPSSEEKGVDRKYQIWGSDRKVGRSTLEKSIAILAEEQPADLYFVGSDWDEGLNRSVQKITKEYKVDAFFNRTPPFGGISFIPDSIIRRNTIKEAVEEASKAAEGGDDEAAGAGGSKSE